MTSKEGAPFPEMVCPVDQMPLAANQSDSSLVCSKGHQYKISKGISRLLTPDSNYAEAFGAQWRHYRLTQLDSYTKTNLSRDRLRRCLGESLWRDLHQRDRVHVLEAGCGAGRFTEILLQMPGAAVTSTDLSSAVEPNQVNCPQSDRHRIIQCNINQLPFRPAQYDIVLCLGVVQHTKSPERTIADLYAQLKPGGWLVIDHYTHSLSHYTRVGDWVFRPILKRMEPAKGLAVTQALTRWLFPLHRAVRKVRPLQMMLSRFSPLLTYYHALPELSDEQQYEWAELDTHDSLTDTYKHIRSRRAIRKAFAAIGARNISVAKGGNGVEARCQRPE